MPTNLFRKAAAVMKDKQSIYLMKISRKKGFRNCHLEAAIIKATSHDESFVDYKNSQRVFDWIKTSPTFLRPFFWSLTKRIEKTRCWVVALKGLMLVHGVFCTKIPSMKKIGRLPFDLSDFHDRYSKPIHAWGFTAFVRAYYAFLDQKSTYMSYEREEEEEEMKGGGVSMGICLSRLERLQTLLGLLLQIKPYGERMEVSLVLDAMDCVVIEIFEVYRGICDGIARVFAGIFAMKTNEAAMALQILQKVISQNAQLSAYFDVCRRMGVLNATELPPVQQIPEEDVYDIEGLIHRFLENGSLDFLETDGVDKDPKAPSGTIVTENWVVFNDEIEGGSVEEGKGSRGTKKDFLYDFGSCLDVCGNGNLNGVWHLQQEQKNLICL